MENDLQKTIQWLKEAQRVLFITGAGLSADSGLPTYRGQGGLYEEEDTDDGLSIEDALSKMTFEHKPELTWKHIARVENACAQAGPNIGHRVMAQMQELIDEVWVLTQNIDGFHHAAGSQSVIDIHGDVHKILCLDCHHRFRIKSFAEFEKIPPPCPKCQGRLRPEVVLFGEMLPEEALLNLQQQLGLGFDLVFSVGTSSLFPYIIEPVRLAKMQGVPTVEINPGETPVSALVDVCFKLGAAECLQVIWDELG